MKICLLSKCSPRRRRLRAVRPGTREGPYVTSPITDNRHVRRQNVEADHAQDFVAPDLPVYKRVLGPRLIPGIERVTVWCADGVITVSESDRDRLIARYRNPNG